MFDEIERWIKEKRIAVVSLPVIMALAALACRGPIEGTTTPNPDAAFLTAHSTLVTGAALTTPSPDIMASLAAYATQRSKLDQPIDRTPIPFSLTEMAATQ